MRASLVLLLTLSACGPEPAPAPLSPPPQLRAPLTWSWRIVDQRTAGGPGRALSLRCEDTAPRPVASLAWTLHQQGELVDAYASPCAPAGTVTTEPLPLGPYEIRGTARDAAGTVLLTVQARAEGQPEVLFPFEVRQ